MSDNKGLFSLTIYDSINAMEEICNKYGFNSSEIELFLPIYYPVAIVRMNMEERVFEDIEEIPYTILRLINLGMTDVTSISTITGLNKDYISSMIKIMHAVRQVTDDGHLTDTGLNSIKEKKNIQLKTVEQLFQIDTLTGDIIKQKQIVDETELYGVKETSEHMIRLIGLPGVDSDYIKKQIINDNSEIYLEKKGDDIHSNVEKINRVDYVETKYARAYILRFRNDLEKPLIFSNRIDKTCKDFKQKFSYQAYFAWTKEQVKDYGLETETISIWKNQSAKKSIKSLLSLVDERNNKFIQKEDFPEKIRYIIKEFFPLEIGLEDLEQSNNYLFELNILPRMITKCNGSLIRLLRLLSRKGTCYLSSEKTNGRMIKIYTNDEQIMDLLKSFDNNMRFISMKDLRTMLLNNFGAYKGDNLVNELLLYLKKNNQS